MKTMLFVNELAKEFMVVMVVLVVLDLLMINVVYGETLAT